jgi:hypothetical protein
MDVEYIWNPRIHRAMSFDGVNDYVSIGNTPSLRLTREVTLEAMILSVSDGASHTVVSRGYAYMINAPFADKIEFYSNDGVESTKVVVPWQYDNKWVHLVGVYRGYTGSWTARAYINGVLVGTHSNPTFDGIRDAGELVEIGRLGGASLRYFNGKISFVRIYNRALNDEEIKYLYENPYAPLEDGLVLWLIPGSIDTANGKWWDLSNYDNHGTIYGATAVDLTTPEVEVV